VLIQKVCVAWFLFLSQKSVCPFGVLWLHCDFKLRLQVPLSLPVFLSQITITTSTSAITITTAIMTRWKQGVARGHTGVEQTRRPK
jgi:hypothetical protein